MTCPNCSKPLERLTGEYGDVEFWGCFNGCKFPNSRYAESEGKPIRLTQPMTYRMLSELSGS